MKGDVNFYWSDHTMPIHYHYFLGVLLDDFFIRNLPGRVYG
jgi:hypothetical protein